jgi:8-amino-7-oxononanoate synthase
MRTEPERIMRLGQIADEMRSAYNQMGYNTGLSVSPIIPITIGEDMLTFQSWKLLFDAGVFVNAVISPAVPPGHQLLRTSYMATHTDEQLERVLEAFRVIGKQLGLI